MLARKTVYIGVIIPVMRMARDGAVQEPLAGKLAVHNDVVRMCMLTNPGHVIAVSSCLTEKGGGIPASVYYAARH